VKYLTALILRFISADSMVKKLLLLVLIFWAVRILSPRCCVILLLREMRISKGQRVKISALKI
jgi:hypothetical protein